MAKHRLSPMQQIEGLRKCLASRKTPDHLRPSIKRFLLRKLKEQEVRLRELRAEVKG